MILAPPISKASACSITELQSNSFYMLDVSCYYHLQITSETKASSEAYAQMTKICRSRCYLYATSFLYTCFIAGLAGLLYKCLSFASRPAQYK